MWGACVGSKHRVFLHSYSKHVRHFGMVNRQLDVLIPTIRELERRDGVRLASKGGNI